MLLETLSTALGGGLLGGAMRLIPEGIKFFTQKSEQAHELKMTELQLKVDTARAAHELDLVHAQASAATQAGELSALVESVKAQARPTGIAWVDAISSTVRPFITYWWMALLSLHKAITLTIAAKSAHTLAEFNGATWSTTDAGTLSMILSYWFIDRTLAKRDR